MTRKKKRFSNIRMVMIMRTTRPRRLLYEQTGNRKIMGL